MADSGARLASSDRRWGVGWSAAGRGRGRGAVRGNDARNRPKCAGQVWPVDL